MFNKESIKSIAICMSTRIGDSINATHLANVLALNGFNVSLLCHPKMAELQSWFPNFTFLPSLHNQQQAKEIYSKHDVILCYAGTEWFNETDKLVKLDLPDNQQKSCVEYFSELAKQLFDVKNEINHSLINPPNYLTKNKYNNRIIIHPSSTNIYKNWPMKKYLKLAAQLKKNNYTPVFLIAPHEKQHYEKTIEHKFSCVSFDNFSDLADFIYESVYMIGNDSGMGHFASCLGVPTLIIFSRKSMSIFWRPGWSSSEVIYPVIRLPGFFARHLWHYMISVDKVINLFYLLVKQSKKGKS